MLDLELIERISTTGESDGVPTDALRFGMGGAGPLLVTGDSSCVEATDDAEESVRDTLLRGGKGGAAVVGAMKGIGLGGADPAGG
jgi:hypothetical protein